MGVPYAGGKELRIFAFEGVLIFTSSYYPMFSEKFFYTISFLGLLCISSCSKDNPVSTETGACNRAEALRRNAFVLGGNGFSNVSINLDTIPASMKNTLLKYAGGVYTHTDYVGTMTLNADTVNLLLLLRMPDITSGSYPWSDRSRDTNAMGCSLVLYKSNGSSSHTYNSTSGGTNMMLFRTNPVL